MNSGRVGQDVIAASAAGSRSRETLPTLRVLIRGSNDVASAVAHRLYAAGCTVLLHDVPQPVVARRGMSFCNALWEGESRLEGVTARCIEKDDELTGCSASIGICCLPFDRVLVRFRPDVLVDARMRKRVVPETQRHLAPYVVGIGPNFTVGDQVHAAVESAYGDALGTVIRLGSTAPLAGEPRDILGRGRDRYVYAPCNGVFTTQLNIGDLVEAGTALGHLAGHEFVARFSGAVRGLVRSGTEVQERAKIIEIDPRGKAAQIRGLGDRPRRIGEGVLAAVRHRSSQDTWIG